jgi:hypothetical protein
MNLRIIGFDVVVGMQVGVHVVGRSCVDAALGEGNAESLLCPFPH